MTGARDIHQYLNSAGSCMRNSVPLPQRSVPLSQKSYVEQCMIEVLKLNQLKLYGSSDLIWSRIHVANELASILLMLVYYGNWNVCSKIYICEVHRNAAFAFGISKKFWIIYTRWPTRQEERAQYSFCTSRSAAFSRAWGRFLHQAPRSQMHTQFHRAPTF